MNEDLAPVPQEKRTWGTVNYFALWVGMAVCIPSYMIASSLIASGMSLFQAILCVFAGNAIVLIPMLLNGMAGTKYGIPYPVFARSSFGILGSNIPALLRAVVACGWFGIQTWIGGTAIMALIKMVWPGFADLPLIFPAALDLETAPFISFMLFWLVNVYLIFKGVESIKILETWCAPLLLLSGFALLFWAIGAVGEKTGTTGMWATITQLMDQPSKFESNAAFWKVFVPSLTGMVGFWATLSLNIPDFTRYAKHQRAQMWGQALGLPFTMTLFALIGVLVTNATVILYGQAIWNPVMLIEKFNSPVTLFVSMFMIGVATLSTNVAANVVGPANDFANVVPEKITFKMGGLITALIGIFMMPWKLIANPDGYIFTWLIGYSSLLGPIGGILIADYFIVRRQRLVVEELYRSEGRYWYYKGTNFVAVFALLLGALPNFPGFLHRIGVVATIPPIFETIYSYAWFVGLPLAGVLYVILMKTVLRPVLEAPSEVS